MSTIAHILAPVKSNALPFSIGLVRETQLRAPKGGCTVGGKVYRGGQFCLPYDVASPHGETEEAAEYCSWLDRVSGSKPLALPEADDEERWAVILAEGPRASVEGFAPTAEDRAWWDGFTLGMDGEHPAMPEGRPRAEVVAFSNGRLSGFESSPEGVAWREERMRLMFGEPGDDAGDGERMEVMGSAAFPHNADWD